MTVFSGTATQAAGLDMRCFKGVAVGFPAGASAYHTKDNWQKATWVLWSTGELRIDTSSFGLIFSPSGGGRLAAKPLGCLTGAAPVAAETGGPNMFVATTNDPVHGLVRLSFQSGADEQAFAALAQAAEIASSGLRAGGRRSSCLGRRSSVVGRPRDDSVDAVAALVSEQHPGCWPLVLGCCELCGPDPHGEGGSEVLLGQGAVVLLDPQDASRVGSYEFLFYDEGSAEPALRLPIGPRTRVARQRDEASGRSSLARRASFAGSDGRAVDVTVPGAPGWTIVFDSHADAAGFERDFSVRQRLVAISLKPPAAELQGELSELRQRGALAALRRLLLQALVLLAVAFAAYACLLHADEPERPVLETAAVAFRDASAAAAVLGERVVEAGAAACSALTRAVPAAALERCTALPDAAEARSCVAASSRASEARVAGPGARGPEFGIRRPGLPGGSLGAGPSARGSPPAGGMRGV
eukprot:CAMPEP_0168432752 /NCGR_PEP_ID=MMETSP0228-20121227/39046_1 /TAXON_ID=133427 /ORGANISM="Protoceratium reticulatum, Strain CCCM 535 (=CCMP 1889)" /LENGTH=469 /DNA_ID=CAMNT_0008446875 /DNA_START=90 /DNA_END=1498 /DNA_ORIENTATION=+